MKKNFLKTICSLILSVLLFSGCQKITEEELAKENQLSEKDAPDQANTKDRSDNNNCRLRSFVQSDGLRENYYYNREGLANRWYLEFGDGSVNDYHIMYDRRNRIKNMRIIFPGDAINYIFYNNGGHTSRATGYLQSTGELISDIFYSYNHKGQMVRSDDNVGDYHNRFYYDNKGDNRRSDFYIGSDLFLTIFLDYDIPNKNPYLALNGVDFSFYSYLLAPLFGKRWNSSGSVVVYEDGNPIVIAEDDPAQTIIRTGRGHYATYASYFDVISESSYDMYFNYSNCGNRNEDNNEAVSEPSTGKKGPMTTTTRLKKILGSHSKNMKQELQEFKRHYLKQAKTFTRK